MELTERDVMDIWNAAQYRRQRQMRIRDYFRGENRLQELLTKRLDGRSKTDAPTNWTAYVAKFHTGFMTSYPAIYSVKGEGGKGALEAYQEFLDQQNGASNDSEHYLNALLYGYSPEVHWFDGVSPQMETTWPWDFAFVMNQKGVPKVVVQRMVADPWTWFMDELVRERTIFFRVYTDTEVITYKALSTSGTLNTEGNLFSTSKPDNNAAGSLVLIDRKPHYYGRPPVVVFRVDENGEPFLKDDFFKQCDIYALTSTNQFDDIHHSVDSMLKVMGMDWEEMLEKDEDGVTNFEKMKQLAIFPVPQDGDADYLSRTVDVAKFKEAHKSSRFSLLLMGAVPDLDETIAGGEGTITNISGVALRLLFMMTVLQSSWFEKQFKVGLRERVQIWNLVREKLGLPVLEKFDVRMKMNIPFNEIELLQYFPNLKDDLSQEDRLKLLPFLDDPGAALANKTRELEGKQGKKEVFPYHIDAGVLTINEVRATIGLDPVPWGDERAGTPAPAVVESNGGQQEDAPGNDEQPDNSEEDMGETPMPRAS